MKKMGTALLLLVLFLSCAALMCRAQGGSQDDWEEYIEKLCEERGICPELIEAMIEQESSWDPEAVNGDCIGLMQINQLIQLPRMQRLGVTDLADPYENILVGVDLMEELFRKYGEPAAALMFYNAGYSDKSGIGAYRRDEMSGYAEKILKRAEELEREHGK